MRNGWWYCRRRLTTPLVVWETETGNTFVLKELDSGTRGTIRHLPIRWVTSVYFHNRLQNTHPYRLYVNLMGILVYWRVTYHFVKIISVIGYTSVHKRDFLPRYCFQVVPVEGTRRTRESPPISVSYDHFLGHNDSSPTRVTTVVPVKFPRDTEVPRGYTFPLTRQYPLLLNKWLTTPKGDFTHGRPTANTIYSHRNKRHWQRLSR